MQAQAQALPKMKWCLEGTGQFTAEGHPSGGTVCGPGPGAAPATDGSWLCPLPHRGGLTQVDVRSKATKLDLGGYHPDKYLSLSSVQPLRELPQHVGVVRPGHALPVFCLNALSGPMRRMISPLYVLLRIYKLRFDGNTAAGHVGPVRVRRITVLQRNQHRIGHKAKLFNDFPTILLR